MNWLSETLQAEPDAAVRSRLLCAFMVKSRYVDLPWYDSGVNDRLRVARIYLEQAAPAALARFEARMEVLRAQPGFAMRTVPDFLPQAMFADLTRMLAELDAEALQAGELGLLGRHKLNNDPRFAPAFACAQTYVEQALGRAVRPVYSMFVRYGPGGKLPVHFDSFNSQFSIGLCLGRTASWPIHCSRVIDRPLDTDLTDWSAAATRADPALEWRSVDPRPNEALYFAPSHQWHCRDPIGPEHTGPYDMVYFSFVDPAAYDLLFPQHWATGFGIPELAELVRVLDLIKQNAEPAPAAAG